MSYEVGEVYIPLILLIAALAGIGLAEITSALANQLRRCFRRATMPPRNYTVTITDDDGVPVRFYKIDRNMMGRVMHPLEHEYLWGDRDH